MNTQARLCFFMLASMLGMFSVGVQAASSDATLCPSKEFTTFLNAFTESTSVQKEFTNLQLKKIITVDVEPEPKQEATLIEKTKMVFPVIPDKKNRMASHPVLGVAVAIGCGWPPPNSRVSLTCPKQPS